MTLTKEQIERLRDRIVSLPLNTAAAQSADIHDALNELLALRAEVEHLSESERELITELLALRAEVERLKRPEVVLTEAERLISSVARCDTVTWSLKSCGLAGVEAGASAATLPEAFAKLTEARRGE